MLRYHDYDPESNESYDEGTDWIWAADDPLVHRLRTMKWTEAPADARERCWDAIKERVALLDSPRPALDLQRGPELNCDRYGFSRPETRRIGTDHRGVTRQARLTAPARHTRPRSLAWAFR
jgi:hypothetical protein